MKKQKSTISVDDDRKIVKPETSVDEDREFVKSETSVDDDREFVKSELAKYQSGWRRKKILLVEALRTCNLFGAPPPEWIVSAVLELVGHAPTPQPEPIEDKAPTPRQDPIEDKAPTPGQDIIDFKRWELVYHTRTESILKLTSKNLIKAEDVSNLVENKLKKGSTLSLENIYDIAAVILKGTIAAGEREAIKKSYLRVEKAMRDGEADHYTRSDFDDYFAMKLPKKKKRRRKVG